MSISVIVPIYNGEKSIERLYIDICNQTYKDYEIIYIVNGSTDNSLEICNSISLEDKRVKVIVSDVKGVSNARNLGIKNSKFDRLMFLDVDDRIDTKFIEKMIANSDADLVICNFNKVINKKQLPNTIDFYNYKNKVVDSNIKVLFDMINNGSLFPVWNKVYKKDILIRKKVYFDENLKKGEDFLFNIYYFIECKKIYCLNDSLYNYKISSSIEELKKYNENILKDSIKIYMALKKISDDYKYNEISIFADKYLKNNIVKYIESIGQNGSDKKKKLKYCGEIINKYKVNTLNNSFYEKLLFNNLNATNFLLLEFVIKLKLYTLILLKSIYLKIGGFEDA